MTTTTKVVKRKRSEVEIDASVVAEADDDSAWDEPIRVKRDEATSLTIPAGLAARAAFLAGLHRERGLEEWLTRIIREPVELEETAFAQVKQELKEKQNRPANGVNSTSDHV